MRRSWSWLLVMVAMMLIVAGCGAKQGPKEALQEAMAKSAEMKSFTFDMNLGIDDLELPPQVLEGGGAEAAAIMNMLSNFGINVKGAYQADPMQMEMVVQVALQGSFSMTVNVPIIMKEDKIWVKIPAIPGVPLDGLADKYIEVDLAELSEQQGADLSALDVDTQRKLGQDVLSIAMKHFDEDTFFSKVEKGSVEGLPSDLKVDEVIAVGITQANFEEAIKAIVNQIAPEVIDLLLANNEYRDALQLSEAELNEAKQGLAEASGEMDQGLAEMRESLQINDFTITQALKDDYIVFQKVKLDASMAKDGDSMRIGLSLVTQYDNINKAVTFTQEIPTDAIPFSELMGGGLVPGSLTDL